MGTKTVLKFILSLGLIRQYRLIKDIRNPTIIRAPKPFNPSPSKYEISVFLRLENPLTMRYDYKFHIEKTEWTPVFDDNEQIKVSENHANILKELKLIPPEHFPWKRVVDLLPSEKQLSSDWKKAINETSPNAGIYVLYSRSRKKIEGKF